MTSRERVLTAFDHREPDRVPLWYGASDGLTARLRAHCGCADDEALQDRLHIDFRRVHGRYIGPDLGRTTIWGVERDGAYYGMPTSHPLAGVTTVEEVAAYPLWPSPDWFDWSGLRAQCEAWREYAVIGGPWVVVFTDATELVGMAEFFEKMYTHPEVMQAVLDRVADFYYELATRCFEAAADAFEIFFFGDDFGTQESLIISPKAWREFCKPNIRRFVELGHQADLEVMFHSCGAVTSILDDLVDLGLDALNPIQPAAKGMDLARLKADYGAHLTFHGALDHQHILPFGTPDEVRAEVRRVLDIMAPGGGFCLAPSHDLLLDEFPPENIVAMYDEAAEYGRY
ncbi:MAG: uroporphyrinogen-III decarboxylase [Armatimonadetes bacterium]|nr:uroporphyrinogen-III decarboxylase [Armatimonadota bacterium]